MEYIQEIRALVGHRPLILVGCGALIVRDGNVLLQKRSDNHLWGIHGGCMEIRETTEQTMIREVYEECGITPTEYELFGVFSGEDVHNIYPNGDECYFVNVEYLVTGWEGDFRKQDSEVEELRWFKISEMPPNEQITPGDRQALGKLKATYEKEWKAMPYSIHDKDYLISIDKENVMQSYGRFPIVFERGNGARVYDSEGKEYIDFMSGIGVLSLGHCNTQWIGAVTKQASSLAHVSNYYYTAPYIKLSERICASSGMKNMIFGNSGAEANEAAIKIARKYSNDKYPGQNRNTIVTLNQSFHGRTVTTLAATGQEHFHTSFMPFTQGFKHVAATIPTLENAITDSVCAVMVEMIRGEGGVLPMEREFADYLKTLQERDILLIIDEVQTGIGRTGKLFAFQHYGLKPDLITMAKGLGGGLPIGACAASERCASVLTSGTHGSTFGGNPVVCAGANAVLDIVNNEDFLESVTKKGRYMKESIEKMNFPFIKSFRGMGLMIGLEIGDGYSHKELSKKLTFGGLLAITAGDDALRFLPPLTITYEEIDAGLAIFERVLREG